MTLVTLTASATPEIVFGSILVAFPLIGALTRAWPAVLAPIVGWPLFYIGLDKRWWLYGTGDGWERQAVFWTLFGAVTTFAAVALGRAAARAAVRRGSGAT